jgi:hypothetical protein
MLQLKSGGYGPDVTVADSLKAAAVTIVGTLALVGGLTGAIKLFGKNPYFESLLAMGWLLPFLFSQHYTYLKGRPARVQAVLIGAPAVIVIAIALGNAWINNN